MTPEDQKRIDAIGERIAAHQRTIHQSLLAGLVVIIACLGCIAGLLAAAFFAPTP